MNSFPGRPSSRSKPNTSPPSSATRSLPNSPKRSLVNSQRGSREPASSIVSADLRSRSMTNSPSSCASRPPPTTSPLSSTTARACPREGGGGTSAGPATRALAPVRKTIYSLKDLREILLGCNRRYLEYLSSLDDFSAGIRTLDRLTQPRPVKGRNLKGLLHHVGAFPTLEDQMCGFAADFDRASAGFSPDRVDALVWELTELLVEEIASWGIYETTRRKAEAVIKARLAATEAGRPKAEPAPGSLEYQALHPEWKPSEE